MRVENTKRINEKIQEYALNFMISNALGIGLNAPISVSPIIFDNYDGIEKASEIYKKQYNFNEDESKIAVMITSVLQGYGQLKNVPADILYEIVKNSRIFHKGDFDNNDYITNIHFENEEMGRFKLTHKKLEKYELFMYDEPFKGKKDIMLPKIGCFDFEYNFPCILEDGNLWMSVTPSELITMQKSIDEVSGNVLTLGCGLGVYAYLVSNKENVKSMTIVEISDEVINLFEKFILPKFKYKEKIKIIKADAFEYMGQLEDGLYDYCFADIWYGNLDTVLYLKMKKLCNRFIKTKMSYWIETSLIETMMTLVFSNILQEFYKNNNIPFNANNPPSNISGGEIDAKDYIFKLLENEEITKPEHIDYYMKSQNILSLL